MQTLGMLLAGITLYITQARTSPNVASHDEQTWLLATFLVNIIVQLYREARQRKWQTQDSERQKSDLEAHEKSVKESLVAQTEELKKAMRTRVTDLTQQLDVLLADENKRRRAEDDK